MFQLRPEYESQLSQRRGAVKNVPGKRISTCEVTFEALQEVKHKVESGKGGEMDTFEGVIGIWTSS